MDSISFNHLRVVIVSGILHPKYGGPVSVIQSHVKGLSSFVHLKIFGVAAADETEEVFKIFPQAHVFRRGFPERWFYGRGLLRALNTYAHEIDVIHAHMLWDYPVLASWLAARQANVPIIISPHGTLLEPWRYRVLHKKIYRNLVVNNILRHTSCIHVLNQAEAEACRGLGIECPIRVIPNGLPAEEFEQPHFPDLAFNRFPGLKDHRVMLYLGRFSLEKRLEVLIKAWSKIQRCPDSKDWLLVLAGSGDREYEIRLRSLVSEMALERKVLLTGFVGGDLKKSLFSASLCFVMPSLSEGFSMAILEAMAAGLPILYTKKCNFPELAANGAGWEVGMAEGDLEEGMRMVTSETAEFLAGVGKRANHLGKQRYNLATITEELLRMYIGVSQR
jgi:glycosyltransferase involved in cell wall biosynthesis